MSSAKHILLTDSTGPSLFRAKRLFHTGQFPLFEVRSIYECSETYCITYCLFKIV
jgi:hypothetical protein